VNTLIFLIVVGTSIWIGFDARGRDFSRSKFARATWQWVVGCLFLWVITFPVYVIVRPRTPLKGDRRPVPTRPPSAWLPPEPPEPWIDTSQSQGPPGTS
jgi:hypothetical protein